MTMLSAMLFLTITVGGIRLANINEGLAHNSTANERLSQLMPILNQITESTEQSGTSAAWVNVALQVKTVTWVIDLGGSSTTPTYSVNENVLDFKPCPNMTSSCANKIPTIYANVKLPFSFTKVKGSFVIKSTGSNLADDCYGGPVGGHSAWGPHITGNDGYVMFGTEANIIYGGCRFGKNVGTETVQVDEVEIVPTDTLKVAVAQSHNQEFLTVDISGIEVYGSGSSADDDKHTTINDMLVGIKDSITEERRKASEAEADMCISSVAAVVSETNVNFAGSTVVEDDATQYKDLNGCSANSECETETTTEAGLAVAAHNEIVRLEADLAVWLTENTTEHGNLKTNQDEKTVIEGKKTTAQTAHTLRLTKFTDAISILKRIDDALDNNGNIVAPAAALVTKEERHAIQQASPVGKAVLLMLNQALSGDVEKDLVVTLKKLLQSCISALESSKAREVTTHADWIVLRDSEITTRTGEITRLTTLLENLATTIANQKVLITAEVTKKSSAVSGLVTKSGACVTGHTNFIGAISDYDTEISAIDEMVRILGEAGLSAETIAIRDEDDSSKHGVKESVSDLATEAAPAAGIQVGENVKFEGLVNMKSTADGTLMKEGGTDGWNAGAHSVGSFSADSNVRGVQFRLSSTVPNRPTYLIGLSHGNTDIAAADIDFAVYPNGYYLYLKEKGNHPQQPAWSMQYKAGDTIKIAVNANGKVEYKVNDVLQYTSTQTVQYPLGVDCSFHKVGGAALNVKWV